MEKKSYSSNFSVLDSVEIVITGKLLLHASDRKWEVLHGGFASDGK